MAVGLRVLSVFIGVFLMLMGVSKTTWLTDGEILRSQLVGWRDLAPAVSLWYLDTIAIPGSSVFSRLVFLGELATGAALVLGYRQRLAATVALLMIVNFHFASGVIFTYGYLTNGYGLPVIGGLLALALGGSRLPYCVTVTSR